MRLYITHHCDNIVLKTIEALEKKMMSLQDRLEAFTMNVTTPTRYKDYRELKLQFDSCYELHKALLNSLNKSPDEYLRTNTKQEK